jgi:hypothetical protein
MRYKNEDNISLTGKQANYIMDMFKMCPAKFEAIKSFFNEKMYLNKIMNLKKEVSLLKTRIEVVRANSRQKDILLDKYKNDLNKMMKNIELERVKKYTEGKL